MKAPELLPWILLLECLPKDMYVYRLCGTGCERVFQKNLTNQRFGSFVDNDWAEQNRSFLQAMKDGCDPIYTCGNVPMANRDFIRIIRGLYGFSTDGKSIDRIMAVLIPSSVYVDCKGEGCPRD